MRVLVVDGNELHRCEERAMGVVVLYNWGCAVIDEHSKREYCHDLEITLPLKRPLTPNERASKGGREADISFWGRLTKRFAGQIPAALSEDTEAARSLIKLCPRRTR